MRISLAPAALLLALSGCGPRQSERLVLIESNHTAFRVPAEGSRTSAKFLSAEFLDQRKVALTQYSLKQRKRDTGRMYWNYEWIPTEFVIVIDRAQKTQDWKDSRALELETVESVSVNLNVSLTCEIAEADAANYVSIFGGFKVDEQGKKTAFKSPSGVEHDPSLAHVMDTHVRGYILAELSREVGQTKLDELDAKVGGIVLQTFEKARGFFKKQGITVVNLGLSAGLRYVNPDLQKTIDERFTSALDIQNAKREAVTAKNKNDREFAKVEAEVAAAKTRSAAKEATLLQAKLAYAMAETEAFLAAANGWDGNPARIVPQGAAFLFGFDRALAPVTPEKK